jgi:hypothetical protein
MAGIEKQPPFAFHPFRVLSLSSDSEVFRIFGPVKPSIAARLSAQLKSHNRRRPRRPLQCPSQMQILLEGGDLQ